MSSPNGATALVESRKNLRLIPNTTILRPPVPTEEGTVLLLARLLEAHDFKTGQHSLRTGTISQLLAQELGYDEEAAQQVRLAGILHDIGKVKVPSSVLNRPSKLGEFEWDLVQQHTTVGEQILLECEGFEMAAKAARWHHERWDGAGYPDGIAGGAIPEFVAIVSVADSLDAMTHERPYRTRFPFQRAVDEIVRCSGRQFSPRVVEALVKAYDLGSLAA